MIKRQNFKHRGLKETTDVLSFPAFAKQRKTAFYKNRFLGDILISLDRAGVQARAQKISLEDEVLFLTIHSLLHLLGHDHAGPRDTKRMQAIESRLWGVLHDF